MTVHLFLPLFLSTSFLVCLFLIPYWIRKAKQIGLVWDDMHKLNSEKVAGSGGLIVILGFLVGVLLFIAYRVFVIKDSLFLVEILALLLVFLIAGGIGLIDDLFGWRHGGLSRRSRLILLIFAAIPLMAINAGKSEIVLPFLGIVDIGLIYPILFIPIGIVGATTTFNFIAGYNGLEAGQGILLLSALAIVSYSTGSPWLSIIALCMLASLLAFLFYNFSPAKVLPGDALTYTIGALVAVISILGNFEKVAVFFFIPYIIEVILKLRGRLVKQSFGKPLKDGSLDLRYKKIYGLEHLSIYLMNKLKIKPTERKVVLSIWTIQLIFIIIGFIIFKEGIFI